MAVKILKEENVEENMGANNNHHNVQIVQEGKDTEGVVVNSCLQQV